MSVIIQLRKSSGMLYYKQVQNAAFLKPLSLFDVGNAFQAVFHREVAHRRLLYCVVPPSLYEGYALQISSGVR